MKNQYLLRSSIAPLAWALAIALLAGAPEANATLYVTTGSTYGIRLNTVFPGQQTRLNQNMTFDGITDSIMLSSGAAATVDESEMDLGGSLSRVDVVINATADIYPAGGGTFGSWSFGFNDPLDFDMPARVLSSSIRMLNATGAVVFQDNLSVLNADPWDGTAPQPGFFTAEDGLTGQDVRTIEFSFNLGAVPAPGTTVLLGMGGLVAARRRRAGPRGR